MDISRLEGVPFSRRPGHRIAVAAVGKAECPAARDPVFAGRLSTPSRPPTGCAREIVFLRIEIDERNFPGLGASTNLSAIKFYRSGQSTSILESTGVVVSSDGTSASQNHPRPPRPSRWHKQKEFGQDDVQERTVSEEW